MTYEFTVHDTDDEDTITPASEPEKIAVTIEMALDPELNTQDANEVNDAIEYGVKKYRQKHGQLELEHVETLCERLNHFDYVIHAEVIQHGPAESHNADSDVAETLADAFGN